MRNKFVIIIVLISVLILSVGVALTTRKTPVQSTRQAQSNSQTLQESTDARLEFVGEKFFDWGDIDIYGGIVEKTFTIKNSGTTDLELTNFRTSCMCTEVDVTIADQKSPSFGMHTPTAWKGIVKPGEEALVSVKFDPLFHGPEAVGPITRLVGFNSNDKNNSVGEFRLKADVIKK